MSVFDWKCSRLFRHCICLRNQNTCKISSVCLYQLCCAAGTEAVNIGQPCQHGLSPFLQIIPWWRIFFLSQEHWYFPFSLGAEWSFFYVTHFMCTCSLSYLFCWWSVFRIYLALGWCYFWNIHNKYCDISHEEYAISGTTWKEVTSVRLWSNQSYPILYRVEGNVVSERKESGISVTGKKKY